MDISLWYGPLVLYPYDQVKMLSFYYNFIIVLLLFNFYLEVVLLVDLFLLEFYLLYEIILMRHQSYIDASK